MGLCRIVVDVLGTDTVAAEAAGAAVEYASAHGGSVVEAFVVVHPGQEDQRTEAVVRAVGEGEG